jgi:hypothetical protein
VLKHWAVLLLVQLVWKLRYTNANQITDRNILSPCLGRQFVKVPIFDTRPSRSSTAGYLASIATYCSATRCNS